MVFVPHCLAYYVFSLFYIKKLTEQIFVLYLASCRGCYLCLMEKREIRRIHLNLFVWNILRKLKIELPFDPALPLLGLYRKNPKHQSKTT